MTQPAETCNTGFASMVAAPNFIKKLGKPQKTFHALRRQSGGLLRAPGGGFQLSLIHISEPTRLDVI
eukprot:12615549-Prorocentrum_lima.AAC.1